jgi:hypothetical protein
MSEQSPKAWRRAVAGTQQSFGAMVRQGSQLTIAGVTKRTELRRTGLFERTQRANCEKVFFQITRQAINGPVTAGVVLNHA